MICNKCEREILEGEKVLATVKAVFHRQSEMVHALDVSEEVSLEHDVCEK